VGREKAFGITNLQIKLRPKLNDNFAARLKAAQCFLEMGSNEGSAVASFGESNFHEANGVASSQCFEVLEDKAWDVPPKVGLA
jgi:hypothetical protein